MTAKRPADLGEGPGYPRPKAPGAAGAETSPDALRRELATARARAADAADAALAARQEMEGLRARAARLARELADLDRPDMLQVEEAQRQAQVSGATLSDLVRASKSYRLGLAAAGVLRLLNRVKRRLRRGAQNPLFDRAFYLATNPDVRWSGRDPYSHYLGSGAMEGRKPNRIFDSRWYLDTYPDVAAAAINPLIHYSTTGAAEGRNPAPAFDGNAYWAQHPEVKAQGINPLLHYLESTDRSAAADPDAGRRRILVVAVHAPSRAHAGGLRMLDLYSYIRSIAPDIRLDLFAPSRPEIDWSYEDLPKVFSNVYFTTDNDLSLANLKRISGELPRYDLVDFQFMQAGADAARFRKIAGRLIFTPMELLSRGFGMMSDAERAALPARERAEQLETSRQELALCRAVDQVVCVSNPDADYLKRASGLAHVTALETGVSQLEFGDLAGQVADMRDQAAVAVFVAYFGSPTNVAALDWFLREVHPLIVAAVPGYRLDVVGRGDLSRFARQSDPSVRIVGEVVSVGPAIRDARIGIAPALGGAGFRGKINQYALLGLPTVASPIAAEGMAYHDGYDIVVGDTAEKFAHGCTQLLCDPARRAEFARRARETCIANYSWTAKDATIRAIYGLQTSEGTKPSPARAEPAEMRPVAPPAPKPSAKSEESIGAGESASVTALVPSYNHAPYIEERIRSILGQTHRNFELVVIDDCSTDGSDAIITRLQAQHGFTYLRRAKNSGTPFSAWEYAARECRSDYVWICESDDVSAPDFLETAVVRLSAAAGAVLYYCNSNVIDSAGKTIDTTATYLRDIWAPRWLAPFVADGPTELRTYQYRGMTVPNMSSALMRHDAFSAAYTPDLCRFKLTGDWLFVGRLMMHGTVVFDPSIHNGFRRHEQTARARTESGRSQAEFVITKFRLHRLAGKPARDLAHTLRLDATRFIYERASAWSVFRAAWRVSWSDTLWIAMALPYSLLFYRGYLGKFLRRKIDLGQVR